MKYRVTIRVEPPTGHPFGVSTTGRTLPHALARSLDDLLRWHRVSWPDLFRAARRVRQGREPDAPAAGPRRGGAPVRDLPPPSVLADPACHQIPPRVSPETIAVIRGAVEAMAKTMASVADSLHRSLAGLHAGHPVHPVRPASAPRLPGQHVVLAEEAADWNRDHRSASPLVPGVVVLSEPVAAEFLAWRAMRAAVAAARQSGRSGPT